MAQVLVAHEAIFTGANKHTHVADHRDGVVAFGAANNVALWRPHGPNGVFHTLKQHTSAVTCVRFTLQLLLSAGEDGRLNVWENFKLTQSVDMHASVVCLAVAGDLVVAGNSVGTVSFFQIRERQLVGVHSFASSAVYPTALAVQQIGESYVVAVAGTSKDLHIYLFSFGLGLEKCALLSGHEDWIKCLAFTKQGNEYILASGSQDRYIRLWRLCLDEPEIEGDAFKSALMTNKKHKFPFQGKTASFVFEALVMGHDDWITGLQWRSDRMQLLSLSADTVMIVWEMDPESGIWVSVARLGEMSIKGASTATGSAGGFWSCLWMDRLILANGKSGAFRVYESQDEEGRLWVARVGVTGPTRAVTDAVWNGDMCVATSLDQTTRLYGKSDAWHEFARPQIHGYDMICLDNITPTKFVSGGDEKVLRVFEMTLSIGNMLGKFCGFSTLEQLPEAASLPVLGLSNKAANEQLEVGGTTEDAPKDDILAALDGPPLEDHLQRHTLFPELEKLYGHGYEITCCAVSPDKKFIASACRSNSAKHAVVRLFNIENGYRLVETTLEAHSLTITSLEFSTSGDYLVAVSRDRSFSVWNVPSFTLKECNPKAHSRIIWDCSWLPNRDMFVTASRDKSVKLWRVGETVQLLDTVKLQKPVTSVACGVNGAVLVAVGNEDGDIDILAADEKLTIVGKLDRDLGPSRRINKLAFGRNGLFAAASEDLTLRIYRAICSQKR